MICKKVAAHYGVAIDVYGFDRGKGMQKPEDYRDLSGILCTGDFPMDVEALRRRLTDARLYLGLIGEMVPKFLASKPAPLGFIAFDLDFYSSTMRGMKVFEAYEGSLLPRMYCVFDDIFACGDFDGGTACNQQLQRRAQTPQDFKDIWQWPAVFPAEWYDTTDDVGQVLHGPHLRPSALYEKPRGTAEDGSCQA